MENNPISPASALMTRLRRVLRSPLGLAVLVATFLLLGIVVPGASYVGGVFALVSAVRFGAHLGPTSLFLFTAVVMLGGALHPVLQEFAPLFAMAAFVRLGQLVVVISVRQVSGTATRLFVATRQMIKLLLLLSASAMQNGKITQYVSRVVFLAYVYPFFVYAMLYGLEALAELGLSWGAAIGKWIFPGDNPPMPMFLDPAALLHIGINAFGFVLGYVVPGIVLLMAASAALASVGMAKKRMQSEQALLAMFVELLLIYAVPIHYLNIVFPEAYHYKNIGWPGQGLADWVGNPASYLKSVADSLFVSAATLTLLGISAVELNSYPAKILYAAQALHGLYILVLGIRKIRDNGQ
eukprot:TRINITY_DN36182_c0_g1_i1.p1 TRINITY_DN36182_c0_g1~~TRINITY_DN36182_c0_g1_i1.p1  ORF type:complete len:353 (+),score=26.09 TRINITY_DN36182_c0_g1_i1:32-1090(+)